MDEIYKLVDVLLALLKSSLPFQFSFHLLALSSFLVIRKPLNRICEYRINLSGSFRISVRVG